MGTGIGKNDTHKQRDNATKLLQRFVTSARIALPILRHWLKLFPFENWRSDAPTIPVVRLEGPIATSSSPFRPRLSLATVAPLLVRAFANKKAPVVAIAINSPGGSPVQSRLIYSRIRELALEKDKKVLVFVEDVAASGGYMIALAGDEIIADETSIVGSIGVLAATFGFDKAISKLGIDRRVYTAGKNKVMLDPFQPEKSSDVSHIKSVQNDMHAVFIDMVKSVRGDRLSSHKDLFTGMFWTGTKARELGLIDGFGHLSAVLKQRYGEKVRLKLIQPRRSLFMRTGVVASIADRLIGGAIEAAEERALWSRYGL